MKRFLILLSLLFCTVALADTINLHWLNEDGSPYQDSTCTIGGDLNTPTTPPTKYGYTFTGWNLLGYVQYVQLEYIASTGTQYVDTGWYLQNSSDDFEINTTFTNNGNQNELWTVVSGVNVGGSGNYQYYMFAFHEQSGIHHTTVNGDINDLSEYNVTPDTPNTYVMRYHNNQTVVTNQTTGQVYTLNKTINGRGTYTAYLFGSHQTGGVGQRSNIKLYHFSIKTNGILVRDFIPVLDTNGVPCLFDRVEAKFYYNKGTGNFIAGPTL